MKKCYLCLQTKSVDEFYRDKTRKDGLTTKCKQCSRTYVKKNIDPNRTHKYCSKCKVTLPLESFAKSKVADGYQSACRTCRSLLPYNITPEEYHGMMEQQAGACAICGEVEKLVVDHCHETQKVRGLLCIKCNWGLGHFKDSHERLTSAAEYLQR